MHRKHSVNRMVSELTGEFMSRLIGDLPGEGIEGWLGRLERVNDSLLFSFT